MLYRLDGMHILVGFQVISNGTTMEGLYGFLDYTSEYNYSYGGEEALGYFPDFLFNSPSFLLPPVIVVFC